MTPDQLDTLAFVACLAGAAAPLLLVIRRKAKPDLRAKRREAIDRFVSAWKRGDTRGQHHAHAEAQALTTALLRQELGR